MSEHARLFRRPVLRRLTLVMAFLLVAVAAPFGPARVDAATVVAAGYRDFVYNGDPNAPGGDDVTAAANQSKLWFNDGRWWGMLFDQTTTNPRFRIWKFDMATQNWTNTNVAVDDRNRSHGDALWVDTSTTLYVASSRREGTLVTGRDLRIYRYAYNTANDTYTVATGFPKTVPGTAAGTGYSTIARDGNGHLWVAFTQANRIRYTTSTDNGVTWSAPADVPGMGNNVNADDVVSVTQMNGGIGFLWSNQAATDDAFYFVAHTDAGVWQARETAMGTPGIETHTADSHISVKTDASGDVLAAIKTARNDGSGNPGDPLVAVVKRTGAAGDVGSWGTHTVTTVSVKGTRPILVLDAAAGQANVFLTYPTLATDGDQAIYRRTAPLSTLNFGTASLGTPFIDSTTEVAINDATSTKQMTDVTSGIIVEAVNIPTFTYFHGCAGDACPDPTVAQFSADTTAGPAPLTVQFTDASTNSPTSWSWTFGDGGTSTAQNPTHVYGDPGQYTVTLTATNVGGSDSETKTDYITVEAPPDILYVPITPKRVLDSRHGTGGTAVFTANQFQTFTVGGVDPIPDTAVAVTGNLTIVGQTAAGYVALGPEATNTPLTSTINFPTGDIRANGVTVKLNDGMLSAVYMAGAGNKAHIIFDVTGYFLDGSSGATFVPVTPERILDTRHGTGWPTSLVHGGPASWTATGHGVDTQAVAIVGNATVVGQTQAGYVAITPDPVVVPLTSTLNFPLGDIRANGFSVSISDTETISGTYRASAGARTHLVVDVMGYYR